jgi:protein arginine kinase activator
LSNICPVTGLPCSHTKCIHITDVGPNYTLEKAFDLCVICASQSLHKNPQPPQLSEVVKEFLNFFSFLIKGTVSEPVKPIAKPPCPSCGYTIMDIIQTSKLGCVICYQHFKEEITPVLHQFHKNIKHTGKVPKTTLNLHELEGKLQNAIKTEDYEKAAQIRDEIKKLKSN